MSFVNERKIIEKRLRDNFDSSLVAIQYENVATLKKGSVTVKDVNTLDKFIKLTISSAGTTQIDVGGNADRYTGIITIGIFIKANKGTNLARKIADDLKHIFHRRSFDGILCRTTDIEYFPDNTDGWYQVNMNTEFYYDETFVIPVTLA